MAVVVAAMALLQLNLRCFRWKQYTMSECIYLHYWSFHSIPTTSLFSSFSSLSFYVSVDTLIWSFVSSKTITKFKRNYSARVSICTHIRYIVRKMIGNFSSKIAFSTNTWKSNTHVHCARTAYTIHIASCTFINEWVFARARECLWMYHQCWSWGWYLKF